MVPFRACLLFLFVSLVVGVYSSSPPGNNVSDEGASIVVEEDEGVAGSVADALTVAEEDESAPLGGLESDAPMTTAPLGPKE